MEARGLLIEDDVGTATLRRFAQAEPGRRAALQALAIAQALEGASRAEAARMSGGSASLCAVVRFNAKGLARLRDQPQSGRPEKLSPAWLEELRA